MNDDQPVRLDRPHITATTDDTDVLVSVILPMYNARAHIRTAIDSVAAQTLKDIELIIVDDCSKDGSPEVALEVLNEHDLKYLMIKLPSNGGPANARNVAVKVARGKYVAFIDADDEWLPGKLASQIVLMESDTRITLCGCQALWVNAETGQVRPLFNDLPTILPNGWKTLLWSCYVATPCAMVRRDDLGTHPFRPSLRVGEDRNLWIHLASNGAVALVQDVMVRIRISSSSYMSNNSSYIAHDTLPMIRGFANIFSDHLSVREYCLAIGSVYSNIGKFLCQAPPNYRDGARYLLLAALSGHNPIDNLRFAFLNAPGIRQVKPLLKQALVGIFK